MVGCDDGCAGGWHDGLQVGDRGKHAKQKNYPNNFNRSKQITTNGIVTLVYVGHVWFCVSRSALTKFH